MGKSLRFFSVFTVLFAFFYINTGFATTMLPVTYGYDCPEYKTYTSCNANYYMSGGTGAGNSCKACGANSTSSGGQVTTCTCNTGYSSNGTSSGSSTSTTGCTLIQVSCGARSYLKKGETSCSSCPPGSYCPGGTFSYNATKDQGKNSCPRGYTSNLGEASASSGCYILVDGGSYIQTANSTTQQTCAAGTYKEEHIVYYGKTSSCSVCGNNQYSDKGAASCSSCNSANGYVNSGTSATNHAGITSCKATCSAGTYVAEANAKCTSVGTGYWKESHTVSQESTSTRNQCPAEYHDGAAVGAEADCVGIFEKTGKQVNGDVPANCASVTAWGT